MSDSPLSALPGLSVLLAEDNMVNRLFLIEFFEEAGHRITVAEDGNEALEALDNGRFDLVLMDVQMPGMDGLEAARRIRSGESAPNIPILALTAFVSDEDRKRVFEAGMDGFTTKPVDLELLAEAIRSVLVERAG